MNYNYYTGKEPIEELASNLDNLVESMFVLLRKFHDFGFLPKQGFLLSFSFGGRIVPLAALKFRDAYQKFQKIHRKLTFFVFFLFFLKKMFAIFL